MQRAVSESILQMMPTLLSVFTRTSLCESGNDAPFKLTGAVGGSLDGIHDGGSEGAFFQLMQTGNGGAAGRGHHGLQFRRMLTGFHGQKH
jgi:hypothetical protein